MQIAQLFIFVISDSRALTIHCFQLVKKVYEWRFSIGSLSMHHKKTINNNLSVLSALHTLVLHAYSCTSKRPVVMCLDKNTTALSPCYHTTFRHLLWQNVQGKILAAMCGIKCIKTLLFAFNFIFWVCVVLFWVSVGVIKLCHRAAICWKPLFQHYSDLCWYCHKLCLGFWLFTNPFFLQSFLFAVRRQ